MTWISYHRSYTGVRDPDDAKRLAANRRADRKRISGLRDSALAYEMQDNEAWLRSAADPAWFGEYASRIRMARHEAIVIRGWPADDPRIRWEPRDFSGPLDEAAYRTAVAAAGLHVGWHDSLYPDARQAEDARRDAAQACGLVGDALRDLERGRGTLAGILSACGRAVPECPRGTLAEAGTRMSRAGDSIRSRAGIPALDDDTPAVAAARVFRDACSAVAAGITAGEASRAEAAEALAKIDNMAELVQNYASWVRDNLREWAPKTFHNELVTRRDWDSAAGGELAAAWHALSPWHKVAYRAWLARARSDAPAAQPAAGHLPAARSGRLDPLTPPGPTASAGRRTSPATVSRSRDRQRGRRRRR